MKCNLCQNGKLEKITTFTDSPIVNNYQKVKFKVTKTNSDILFCSNCQSIKNYHLISPDKIFENYSYSSFDTNLAKPIEDFIVKTCDTKNIKNIMEVGCNNGNFLKNITQSYTFNNATGIDPSSPTDNDDKIIFIKDFFNKETIQANNLNNKSDFIIARHMFAHVPNPEIIAEEMAMCATDDAFIYIENANLENTVIKKDYSQLYLEHFYALSPKSIEKIFSKYGFFVEEIENFPIHNGSFGILLKRNSSKKNNVIQNNYDKNFLQNDIKAWMLQCESFFNSLSTNNNFIWGVTAKTVMMLNMLNINTLNGKNIFKGAYDFTPLKNQCFAPGTDILISQEPDNILNDNINIMIGARNFSDEIIEKIKIKMPNANIIIPPF